MGEIDDRVPDQLPWTVVGRLTAAVGPDHFDVPARPFAFVPKQVVRACRLAHREHMRVLEQQKSVGRVSIPDRGDDLGLEVPGRAVAGATQPAGSYVLGLVHQRGMRIEPEVPPRHARSPSRAPALSAGRTPLAGSNARPRHGSWSVAGTGQP